MKVSTTHSANQKIASQQNALGQRLLQTAGLLFSPMGLLGLVILNPYGPLESSAYWLAVTLTGIGLGFGVNIVRPLPARFLRVLDATGIAAIFAIAGTGIAYIVLFLIFAIRWAD